MNESSEDLKPGNAEWDKTIAEAAKGMVGGLLALVGVALDKATPLVNSEDPLSAERYVHLAEKLSDLAVTMDRLSKSLVQKEDWE